MPSELTSIVNSLLPAVVLLKWPNDKLMAVYPVVLIPLTNKNLPTVFVKNTFPLPEAPVYPVEEVEVLTSTSGDPEVNDTGLPFCQPLYKLITVFATGVPTFSKKIVV